MSNPPFPRLEKLANGIERLQRIATLARAAVQPSGNGMSIDTAALHALMKLVHEGTT